MMAVPSSVGILKICRRPNACVQVYLGSLAIQVLGYCIPDQEVYNFHVFRYAFMRDSVNRSNIVDETVRLISADA